MKPPTPFIATCIVLSTLSVESANVVIDSTFEDNQNDLEYYWYYYDDNNRVGPNERPQSAPSATPSVINVPYVEKQRQAFGDLSDTHLVKEYQFTTTQSLGKKCATMPFTFGDPWEADYCAAGKKCAMPFVGISTMLAKEGTGIDLTGVQAIHFFVKSRVNLLLEVRVLLQTLDIETYSNKPGNQIEGDEYGFYGYVISVEHGVWQEYTIPLSDLDLPGPWAHDFDFDSTKCTRLSWEIKGDGEITVDTLDIADVYLTAPDPGSPTMWTKVEPSMPRFNYRTVPQQVYVTFDSILAPLPNVSWHAFTDKEFSGTTSLYPDFIDDNSLTGNPEIRLHPQTGADSNGCGALIEYTFGHLLPRDSILWQPYAGIGMNLYDSANAEYWDILSNGSDGTLFFQYKTEDIACKFVTMEVFDINDVGDATTPSRRYSRGEGITYYINFPPTQGIWRTVRIPFNKLVTRTSWSGYREIPFDQNKLAKIRWKVSGHEGNYGQLSIDNVYFPGLHFGTTGVQADNRDNTRISMTEHLFTLCRNGEVTIAWAGAAPLVRGTLQLIDIRGRIAAHTSLVDKGRIGLHLFSKNLPSGTYLAVLRGEDHSGNTVNVTAKYSVVY